MQEQNQQDLKKETQEVQFESKMYLLYEMRDELNKTVSSIDKVIGQQEDLIALVKKNSTKKDQEKWGDFLKGLKESNVNYTNQKVSLVNKSTYLTAVIDLFEKRETDQDKYISKIIDVMVTYTIIALGIH